MGISFFDELCRSEKSLPYLTDILSAEVQKIARDCGLVTDKRVESLPLVPLPVPEFVRVILRDMLPCVNTTLPQIQS